MPVRRKKDVAIAAGILLLAAGGAAVVLSSRSSTGGGGSGGGGGGGGGGTGKPSVTIIAEIISTGATTKSRHGVGIRALETATVPVTVKLTATVAGGVTPYTFSWGFGDSSTPASGNPVTHTYNVQGVYIVSVQVTDAAGQTISGSGELDLSANTGLTISAPQYAAVGSSMKITVVLKDSSGKAIVNQPVTLYQGTTYLALADTDTTGTATFTVTAPSTAATYQYSAQFQGIVGLLGASTSGIANVTVYAPLSVSIGAV